MAKLLYFNLKALRWMSRDIKRVFATVFALLAVFIVLGAFMLTVSNLNDIIDQWSEELVLTVYLSSEMPANDRARLVAALEQTQEVAEVEYITPEKSRDDLAQSMGIKSDIARNMEADLFPGILEVRLASAYLNEETLSSLTDRLGRLKYVEEVVTYRELYSRLVSIVRLLRTVSVIFGALVVLMTITVISATIRLALAKHRKEFEIMKLCGATNRFITAPFMIEGALTTVASMGIALLVLFVIHIQFGSVSGEILPLLRMRSISFMSASSMLMLFIASAFAGAAGSHLAIRKHLSV